MQPAAKTLAAVAAALLLLACVCWLGIYVDAHGEPRLLWQFALAVRGHAIGLAWFFTQFGWIEVFAPFFAIAIVIALRFDAWRARMLYIMCSCLAAWGLTNLAQRAFMRPRRADWLVRHEHAFSFPSSHASTSTAFYLLAGILVLTSDLPRAVRWAGFAVLVALWAGICWSRLALAAHYPTDVAGGILLGAAVALAGSAVLGSASKSAVRV